MLKKILITAGIVVGVALGVYILNKEKVLDPLKKRILDETRPVPKENGPVILEEPAERPIAGSKKKKTDDIPDKPKDSMTEFAKDHKDDKKTNYNKPEEIAKEELDLEFAEMEENAECFHEKPSSPMIPTEEVHVISASTMINQSLQFTKVYLEYYPADDILCTEDNGAVVDDPDSKLCTGWRSYFGLSSSDENELCVRNESTSCDYHISLVEGSYYDVRGDGTL